MPSLKGYLYRSNEPMYEKTLINYKTQLILYLLQLFSGRKSVKESNYPLRTRDWLVYAEKALTESTMVGDRLLIKKAVIIRPSLAGMLLCNAIF